MGTLEFSTVGFALRVIDEVLLCANVPIVEVEYFKFGQHER